MRDRSAPFPKTEAACGPDRIHSWYSPIGLWKLSPRRPVGQNGRGRQETALPRTPGVTSDAGACRAGSGDVPEHETQLRGLVGPRDAERPGFLDRQSGEEVRGGWGVGEVEAP